MKTLLIGANSTIAQALQENSEREFLNFSRSEGTLDLDGDAQLIPTTETEVGSFYINFCMSLLYSIFISLTYYKHVCIFGHR